MAVFPRTGASVIVFQDNKLLLIKRGKEPYKGHWSLPGGSQEPGETLEECARRELLEETALTVNHMEFAAVRDRINKTPNGELAHHFVLTTFLANGVLGEATAGDDADDIGWFTLEAMQTLKTTPETPSFAVEILTSHGLI
ncbi:MAG: NUDIX hydrolase [Pseudomonadota bacterium]